jgi:excisionase family DNA binding protein
MGNERQLLLTIEQCVERLQLNRSAVYRAIQSGTLRSCKIGRLRRVSERSLLEFIDRQEGRTDGWEPVPLGRRPGTMETR